jgi:hypothetical protein
MAAPVAGAWRPPAGSRPRPGYRSPRRFGPECMRAAWDVKRAHCLTRNVLERDSLPHVRKYSRHAELRARHAYGKKNGNGGPVDREAAIEHGGRAGATRKPASVSAG